MGIGYERAGSLPFQEHAPQMMPMSVTRRKELDVRLAEPCLYYFDGFVDAETLARKFGICSDSQERSHGLPGYPYRLAAGEGFFDPCSCFRMLRGSAVVRVKKNVRIQNDHLCSGPSRASISSPTLS